MVCYPDTPWVKIVAFFLTVRLLWCACDCCAHIWMPLFLCCSSASAVCFSLCGAIFPGLTGFGLGSVFFL